jgi:hypothetical protein
LVLILPEAAVDALLLLTVVEEVEEGGALLFVVECPRELTPKADDEEIVL